MKMKCTCEQKVHTAPVKCIEVSENAGEKICEILDALKKISRCEALEESNEFCGVFGISDEELREQANFPEKYFGKPHFVPMPDITEEVCAINELRAQIRRC